MPKGGKNNNKTHQPDLLESCKRRTVTANSGIAHIAPITINIPSEILKSNIIETIPKAQAVKKDHTVNHQYSARLARSRKLKKS